MSPKNFAALLGFAYVVAWIAFGFGNSLLCLLGAGVFYGAAAVAEGQVDLGQLQDRLRSNGSGSGSGSGTPPPARPPRRVQ